MKYLLGSLLLLLMCVQPSLAQMEKGDREVRFAGSIYAGKDFSMTNLIASYGYNIEKDIQVGIGPNITYTSSFGSSETTVGATIFGRRYFASTTKMVPYVSAQWYQYDLSPKAPMSFTDASYIQVGGGMKYFVNEFIAWDASANLGFSLGGGGTALLVFGGVSAIF